MDKLKTNLRQFLNGFKNQEFEFNVNGKVLEATLYNTGINEVLEKITQKKVNMLYSTEEIFKNAQYLYSTSDYAGDPNVYRWNYFYTPVEIGNETVGVRIAVRDMVKGTEGDVPESQIYNWGIKKDVSLDGGSHSQTAASSGVSSDTSYDTSLDGVGRGNNRISHGISSDVSNNRLTQKPPIVNNIISNEGDNNSSTHTDITNTSEGGEGIASFGGIDTESGKHLNKAQQDEVRAIGEKLGRTVEFEDFYKLDKFKGKKKIPDGYIDKDGNIHINFYAKRPVYFLFKHEITHYLKRAKFSYQDFMNRVIGSNAFKNWLSDKGYSSIDELKAEIMDTYSEVEGFNEEKCYDEILADFVGERLFGGKNKISQDLINALEPKQRKTFLDVIKDIIEFFKRKFSDNARISSEIESIEKEFIKVYNEAVEVKTDETSMDDGEQYSIVNLDNGKSYVQASRKVITGNSVSEWRRQISNFFNKSLRNGPIEIKTIEGDTLTISKETAKKARDRNVTENGITRRLTDEEFLVKLHAESHIDELAEISISQKSNKGIKNVTEDTKEHTFAKEGFTYRTVYFQDYDGGYYKISLSIGENNGISTVYNVGKIKADDIPNGNIVSAIGSKADMSSTDYSIPNDAENVNDNYSIPSQNSAEDLLYRYESGEITRQEYLDMVKKEKVLNPKEIANLTEEDANTTPHLERKKGKSDGDKTSKFHGSLLGSDIFDNTFNKTGDGSMS